MEMAIILFLLLVIAIMGTIIVFTRREKERLKKQVEILKESLLNAFNAISNGRKNH